MSDFHPLQTLEGCVRVIAIAQKRISCSAAPRVASPFYADIWHFHFARSSKLDRGPQPGLETRGDAHSAEREEGSPGPAGMGCGSLVVDQDYARDRSPLHHLDRLVAKDDEPSVDFWRADGVRHRRGAHKSPATSRAHSESNVR